jgi:hypothetical protein
VGYMDEYGMTVVVQIDLSCELTACTLLRMTSLTETLAAHFVTNIRLALSFNSNLQNIIERDGRLTARFGF